MSDITDRLRAELMDEAAADIEKMRHAMRTMLEQATTIAKILNDTCEAIRTWLPSDDDGGKH